MALTDTAIRAAKPKERDYKLADGGGLYLLVTKAGGKLWRLKYRAHGVERKLALGKYPDVTLGSARKARDEARAKAGAGDDPAAAKRRERVAAKLAAGTTFGAVALEYVGKAEREGRATATITKLHWAREWLQPAIGHRPVDQVEPHELLAVLKKQEAQGNLETARRTRAFASRVFRYAVATARAKADPAGLLLGAVASPKPKNLSAIVDPQRIGELLRAIDGYTGQPATRLALALSPHVFVRPGELRQAEWSEFDLEANVWRIPAARMKKRREHVVPLSRQALAILGELRGLTGGGRLVFPAMGKRDRPLSENTANAALRRMGFGADEMTAHGFRAMASTLLNESGKWHPDAIERALAHRDSDQVRAAYHRGAHWDERVRMAQWWSDKLDSLRDGAQILPFTPSEPATETWKNAG
ncbi:tyrosine-type recombinase/integrase [Sphingomonas bacterium]|uniref:tyrosine-type recombinase/integrase n=1 Tax=Sphingomonas bacterium TaxID=1895847 RepID=UPI001575519F|nr:integrase arm-type DNA-binding domain-containing protein [Sphingomonas bacterium]